MVELYEGGQQVNATAFSSLERTTTPIAMRQAYILGTTVTALATTLTERGITGKNILSKILVSFTTAAGNVLSWPRTAKD